MSRHRARWTSESASRLATLTLVLGVCAVALGACEDSTPEAQPPPPASPDDPPPSHPSPGSPAPTPLARVARVEGGRPLLRRGQALSANTTVATGQESLVIDLREGARVTVKPGSRVRVGDEAPAQLIVGGGQLHAELPPQGASPRPALRLGTPAGTVELPSGHLWLTVRGDGSAWVAVLTGRARVYLPSPRNEVATADGAGPDAPRDNGGGQVGEPRRVELGPGQSLVLRPDAEGPTAGPTSLDAAQDAAAAFVDGGSDVDGPDGAMEEVLSALAEAEAAAGTLRAAGASVEARHRAATSAMRSEAARLQRELVTHAQRLERDRGRLRLRWERARAWALLLELRPDPTSASRPGVREALGLGAPR